MAILLVFEIFNTMQIRKSIINLLLVILPMVSMAQERHFKSKQELMGFLYKSAYQAQREYRPKEALHYIDLLLQVDSNSIQAHNLKGYVYEESFANYDSAMICYQKTLQLDSNYVKGYVNIGHLYYLKREYAKANEHNKRAIEIDSNYADAYFNLGWICNEENYLYEAIGYMRKASQKGSQAAKKWLEEFEAEDWRRDGAKEPKKEEE